MPRKGPYTFEKPFSGQHDRLREKRLNLWPEKFITPKLSSKTVRPEPTSPSFRFDIATKDGHPVGTCPPNSGGCVIYFSNPFIAITLPDIPNQYVNHDTLTCTIKRTVVTGTYGCQTAKLPIHHLHRHRRARSGQ
jgi:hypothetical protein